MEKITFVLTSCNRPLLLEKTLTTFLKYNTYPISKYIVIEDSGNEGMVSFIKTKYPDIEIIFNSPKLGQIKSIDKAYANVSTEYIFHCEDDWEFLKPGFVEKSLKILKANSKTLLVWLIGLLPKVKERMQDADRTVDDVNYRILNPHHGWYGFSWNPGLRRAADYTKVAPFEQFNTTDYSTRAERRISEEYHKMGYYAATLLDTYVRHTGKHMSVTR